MYAAQNPVPLGLNISQTKYMQCWNQGLFFTSGQCSHVLRTLGPASWFLKNMINESSSHFRLSTFDASWCSSALSACRDQIGGDQREAFLKWWHPACRVVTPLIFAWHPLAFLLGTGSDHFCLPRHDEGVWSFQIIIVFFHACLGSFYINNFTLNFHEDCFYQNNVRF